MTFSAQGTHHAFSQDSRIYFLHPLKFHYWHSRFQEGISQDSRIYLLHPLKFHSKGLHTALHFTTHAARWRGKFTVHLLYHYLNYVTKDNQFTNICNNFCSINQQTHTIATKFTIILLEKRNSYIFQTLMVHHQELYYLLLYTTIT